MGIAPLPPKGANFAGIRPAGVLGDVERVQAHAHDLRKGQGEGAGKGAGHVPMEEVAARSAADAKAFLLEDRVTGR